MSEEDKELPCNHHRQWVGENKEIKLPCADEDCREGHFASSINVKGIGLYIRVMGHYNKDTTKWLYGWTLAKN